MNADLDVDTTEQNNAAQSDWAASLSDIAAVTMVTLAIAWSINLPRMIGFAFYPAQLLSVVLGLALFVTFLTRNYRGEKRNEPVYWYDKIAAIVGLAVGCLMALRYPDLVDLILTRPFEAVALGALLLPLLLEALRRVVGPTLVIVILLFILYAFFGNFVPGRLVGKAQDWEKVAAYLSFDVNGVLGVPLQIASTVVISFILFGLLLSRTGGAKFFTDAALLAMGGMRGGAMKIAVLGSAIFGSISGSAVANVMSTGVVTIPMIKRTGYPAHRAAAIEAVASTGGQLLPPVMGSAAFLMAEFLYVPYSTVALAALVPGLLYYAALFIQADLEAVRHNIAPVPKSERPIGRDVRTGLHFVLSFVVLITTLFFFNWQPAKSALAAAVMVIISAAVFGYQGQRATFSQLWKTYVSAGHASIDLVLICAGAGMVIGVLNMTGLSFNLTFALVQLGGGSTILLLLMSAVVCMVLGMGLPTLGVYVLLATLVAPALVEVGVDKVAAHLYVLYFGMMSMITPPVAIAAFAAASIAGSTPMRTALEAVRFGWPAYVVPFLFALAPSLILRGSAEDVILAVVTALMGVWCISAAIAGFYKRELSALERLFLAGAGLALMMPHEAFLGAWWTDIAGFAAALAFLFWVKSTLIKSA